MNCELLSYCAVKSNSKTILGSFQTVVFLALSSCMRQLHFQLLNFKPLFLPWGCKHLQSTIIWTIFRMDISVLTWISSCIMRCYFVWDDFLLNEWLLSSFIEVADSKASKVCFSLTCWGRCTSQWWPAQTGPWSWEEQPQTPHIQFQQSPRFHHGTAWSETEQQRKGVKCWNNVTLVCFFFLNAN